MIKKKLILFLVFSFLVADYDRSEIAYVTETLSDNAPQWCIVGAGVAGIITIGVLLDVGVDPKKIVWIDPEFNVGRMGKYYSHVESNNKIKDFIAFINACAAFRECPCSAIQGLKDLDPSKPAILDVIVQPMQCITNYLRNQVDATQDSMVGLKFNRGLWYVTTKQHGTLSAQHVVLATGSHPRALNINTQNQQIIPLDYALDPETLKNMIIEKDVLGIIGGAHSAILLLKYLSEIKLKHVFNFYRHPITYALDQGCWALDQFGIKGTTGEWAKNVLEKSPPAHITRIQFDNVEQLPGLFNDYKCNKLIYAIGYDAHQLPAVNGTLNIDHYDGQTGVIAPRLFGIGIAFPEHKIDDGHPRHIIGINCFMDYAQRLIPHWVHNDFDVKKIEHAKKQKEVLGKMENLLFISAL